MAAKLFITGTMRTGSSLVSNVLSVHSKILILSDRVHFFRFIYKKYDPLNKSTVRRMLLEQRARLFHRFGLDMDTDGILKDISARGFEYPFIYDEIMKYFLKKQSDAKVIWGDDPALEWRNIPAFLRLFPDGKAIQICRDPRAVMTSWKKATGIGNNAYINAMFNGIDCLNHAKKYSETLDPKRYFLLKYENLSNDPETWVKKLCSFLEVDFEKPMLEPDKWKEILGDKVALGRSSFDGAVTGFSSQRANRWMDLIEKWELAMAETLAGCILKYHGYELIGKDFTAEDFSQGLYKIKNNDFLLRNLNVLLSTGEGCDKYPLDPTDYRSWAFVSGKPGARSGWFRDTPQAEAYIKEIEDIRKQFAGV